jgi:hypothetical protein
MQYVNYLIQTRENVKKHLYANESKLEIDRNIQHFTGKMRPVTGKILRMLITRFVEDNKGKQKLPVVDTEM